jgi:hypothetical protein
MFFFSKKNILIPNVAEKNILILVEEKKNNLIQSFCHNLMLNSGEKNILTLALSEKKILNETKNHNPPCKLNGRSLKTVIHFLSFVKPLKTGTNYPPT